VYDVETSTGVVLAGDCITKQCRCTVAIYPANEDLTAEQQTALAWLNAKGYSRRRALLKEAQQKEALVPGWAWGKTTIQPASFATTEQELYARYKVVPWRDVPRVGRMSVESWSEALTPVTLALDRPDCAIVRAYGERREVRTWEGWRSVLMGEGDWIETMTGWALDSATIQPSWDERQQRLPLLLLGYYPALRAVTFPIASPGGAYAMKLVDRATAERISLGLIDPGEALPATGERFGDLALQVLASRPGWDPYLVLWITEPTSETILRTIVSLSTGAALYSNTPFDGVFKAPYLRVAAAVFEPPNGIWAVIPRGRFDWALPGGHIDLGETPLQAIIREMREEVGLDVVPQRVLGRLYRPWSETVVYLARRVGEPHDVESLDEIDAVSAIPFDQLVADERIWLSRRGIRRAMAEAFDPGRHPRAPAGAAGGGQFTKGAGGPAEPEKDEPETPPSSMPRASPGVPMRHRLSVAQVAQTLRFPAEKITVYETAGRAFEVGGRQWHEAGHFDPNTGEISLYSGAFGATGIVDRGLLAHEVQHVRFHAVMEKYKEENTQFLKDRDAQDDAGFLKPGAAKKYPTLAAIQVHWEGSSWHQMVASDGLTEYSKSYWNAARQGKGTTIAAINETLAEIARIHEATGVIQGDASWRGFYKMINKVYAKLKPQLYTRTVQATVA